MLFQTLDAVGDELMGQIYFAGERCDGLACVVGQILEEQEVCVIDGDCRGLLFCLIQKVACAEEVTQGNSIFLADVAYGRAGKVWCERGLDVLDDAVYIRVAFCEEFDDEVVRSDGADEPGDVGVVLERRDDTFLPLFVNAGELDGQQERLEAEPAHVDDGVVARDEVVLEALDTVVDDFLA